LCGESFWLELTGQDNCDGDNDFDGKLKAYQNQDELWIFEDKERPLVFCPIGLYAEAFSVDGAPGSSEKVN
jgi:hypothetical protein